MRLLNTSTYQLESFLGTEKPPYAILSHTWELEGEILFNDLQLPPNQLSSKAGWSKVKNTCDRAIQDGYSYAWLDTCCIDKASSAELSEAINSMFRWYKQSAICYAFLADIDLECILSESGLVSDGRWFTRGWTLQELIAPDEVLFYDMNWRFLGSRGDLASVITSATKIPKHVLDRSRQRVEDALQSASIAQRMAWASTRVTTREEDIAYCLMGIFDVNMPLLYGEGQKAFFRLQEAIIYASKDQSILAFRHPDPQTKKETRYDGFSPVLAPDPSYFCDDIRREGPGSYVPGPVKLEYGNITLRVTLIPIRRPEDPVSITYNPTHVALLDCACGNDYLSRPGLLLQVTDNRNTFFKRCASQAMLVRSTMETRCLMQVFGSENTADAIECTPENWMKAERKWIRIDSHRSDTTRSTVSDIRQPIVLGYMGVLDHCLFSRALPNTSSEYPEIVLWESVGLALFVSKGVEFFVAWGHDTEPWCSIQTFNDLTSTWNFRHMLPGLRYDFGAEALMEEFENTRLPEQDLIKLFKKVPFIWFQPFKITTSRIVAGTIPGAISVKVSTVIRGRLTDREFVGRKYCCLEIFTVV